jgi:hypothetical protein
VRCFQLLPLFLVVVFPPVTAICADNSSIDAEPAVYQWVDDNGTVNFSDNPMRIPGKYSKKIKKRQSIQSDTLPTEFSRHKPVEKQAETSRKEQYDGHEEGWWRARYRELRTQMQTIKDAVPDKEARLKELHFKKVTSNSVGMSPGVSGNPRKNRLAYLDLYAEIETDKKLLAALEKELEILETDAARAGVPLEWRR